MNTLEERIHALLEDGQTVAVVAEATLDRDIVYLTRARTMSDAIRGVCSAMNELERVGIPTDVSEQWDNLKVRLTEAQSRFTTIINGSGDITQPPCRPVNSREWA
jgi:hypothetical protein